MIFEPITIIKGNDTGFAVPLKISADPGSNVVAVLGDDQVSGVANADGMATLILPKGGVWSVNAEMDGNWLTPKEVDVPLEYSLKFSFSSRLPAGYTEVEYIDSNAGSYLNTGVTVTLNTRILIDFEPLEYSTNSSNGTYIVQAFTYSGSTTNAILVTFGKNSSQGTGLYCSYIGGTATTYTKRQVSSDITLRRMLLDWDMYNGEIRLDGTPVSFSAVKPSSWGLRPATCFPAYSSTYSAYGKTRLYSLKLYDSDAIQADLVPCIDPNGDIGLYDMIRASFYKSASSAYPFIAGPAV